MSSTYTGVPGNITPASAVDITEPADGDGLNAASVNVGLSELTDYVAFFKQFVKGLTGDDGATLSDNGVAGTDRKLFIANTSGTAPVNIYKVALGWEIVVGAAYSDVGNTWAYVGGAVAAKYDLGPLGALWYTYSGANNWATGAWVAGFGVSQNGSEYDLAVTGAADITGNVVSGSGYIQATLGNVIASGDPVSDQGRVKCLQFVTTGSAPTGSKGVALNNGGVDGTLSLSGASNGVRGEITAETGAVVSGVPGDVITVVTFNKAYPAAPIVLLYPANALASDLTTPPYVESAAGTFTIKIGATPLQSGGGAGGTYKWNYHVVG